MESWYKQVIFVYNKQLYVCWLCLLIDCINSTVGDIKYYGRLKNIIELQYAEGMPVVIFKCKWYNTDPMERGTNFKIEHGLLSIDTSTTWYEDSPYCLATKAQQVFYLKDPKMEGRWMVVNEIAQRGTYTNSCVARGEEDGDNNEDNVNEPYQEDGVTNIPMYMENEQEDEEEEYDEDHLLAFGSLVNLDTILDDDQLDIEDVEDMEEVEFDYAQQTDDEVEVYEDVSGDEE